MVNYSTLLSGALLAAALHTKSGDKAQCKQYMPVGWPSGNGNIMFYDNNPTDEPANGRGFHAPTLPANASAVNPWALSDHTTSTGDAFVFAACNVTSLGIQSPTTQSSCSHGGCYTTYTNYVAVINPHTGHCLTFDNKNATTTKLWFKKCNPNPDDRSQLWETDQQVLYSPGFGKITSYGTVDFNYIDGVGEQLDEPFQAFVLDRSNNKTIELMQYQYTQDGLSAKIVQA